MSPEELFDDSPEALAKLGLRRTQPSMRHKVQRVMSLAPGPVTVTQIRAAVARMYPDTPAYYVNGNAVNKAVALLLRQGAVRRADVATYEVKP